MAEEAKWYVVHTYSGYEMSLIHISEPTTRLPISYAGLGV